MSKMPKGPRKNTHLAEMPKQIESALKHSPANFVIFTKLAVLHKRGKVKFCLRYMMHPPL